MSLRTPKLDLPYIAPAQAQKHVTHNEAIRALDALVQLSVTGIADSPAENPEEGERYIVGDNPTGVFDGQAQNIAAFQDNAWSFFTPQNGWRAYEQSQESLLVFTGTEWQAQTSEAPPPEFTPQLGVNGTADDVNRLLVRSEASLMDNVGAGHQFKVNKAGEGDTASLLFQSGYQGHAEMGLTGNNDFSVRVSPDGGTFHDGLKVNHQNGAVSFPNGANTDMLLPTIAEAGDGAEVYGFPNLTTIAVSQPQITLVANRVYFNAVFIERPTEITGGLLCVTNSSSDEAAVFRLGIFDIGAPSGNSWSVGGKRVDFGAKSAAQLGAFDYTLAAPVTLERGWYMFAAGTNGATVRLRYIASITPGQLQFSLQDAGASTLYRVVGPSAYSYINNQDDAIKNGVPDDWGGLQALDIRSTTLRNYMFFLLKFKHWNAPS